MAKHTGIWFAVLWLAQGCIGPALLERLYDADNDGYRSAIGGYGDDCNDSNAAVHPDMPETCGDNLDNDCDGLVDEWGENGITVFEDLDGDGVGSNKTRVFCTVPETGWSHESGDCNDQNDSIFPGAAEVCNGLDDDCNLQIDDNAAPLTFHPDLDGDGYTVPTESIQGCLPPEGWTSLSLGTDCDDASAAIHPGADEVWYDGVDQDCDPTTEWDQDGDGALHPSAPATPLSGAEDCDDLDPHISPFAEEVWYDGVDQDCDPTTEWDRDGDGLLPLGAPNTVFSSSDCDDGTPIITVPKLYYPDSDLDGFGSEQAPVLACTPPGPLFALIAGDCDDSSAAHHPGAPELCNEVDDNCDGTVDEGIGTLHWPDLDADGAGDAVASPALMCFTTPGWVTNSTDCDDSTESVHPGIDESCDGIDNDCDGLTDEGTRVLSYLDFDGDGHGANGLPPQLVCPDDAGNPSTGAASPGDCDDGNAQVYPGSVEVCDGLDNNCNAAIDEGQLVAAWPDGDQDGFGDGQAPTQWVCPSAAVSGSFLSLNTDDCNDSDPSISPAAAEVCNHVDDDCDGDVDPGLRLPGWPDHDGDGEGDATVTPALLCPDDLVTGWSLNGDDCDDGLPEISTQSIETCDAVDNNCNGVIDEGLTVVRWPDADGDGYGAIGSTPIISCMVEGEVPEGSANALDCDDTTATVQPAAGEACNGIDDDCDGQTDEYVTTVFFVDDDEDGFGALFAPDGTPHPTVEACISPGPGWSSSSEDCDDASIDVFPGRDETCDAVDNDCDGLVNEGLVALWYKDVDGDGWGGNGEGTADCQPPNDLFTWVTQSGDCDKDDPNTFPGALEVCDGVDNNCNDLVDEGQTVPHWPDDDGDGQGNDESLPVDLCPFSLAAAGMVTNGADCDDANPLVYWNRIETCDGIDNDCNGQADEGLLVPWYPDADNDGYGDIGGTPVYDCPGNPIGDAVPGSRTDDHTDCDDSDAERNPGAFEVCNGEDEDCDGQADGPLACSSVAMNWSTWGDLSLMQLRDPTEPAYPMLATFEAAAQACDLYGYRLPRIPLDDIGPLSWMLFGEDMAETPPTSTYPFALGGWMGVTPLPCNAGGTPYYRWYNPNDTSSCDVLSINELFDFALPLVSVNTNTFRVYTGSVDNSLIPSPSHLPTDQNVAWPVWCELRP